LISDEERHRRFCNEADAEESALAERRTSTDDGR
jgi:hypothetical protein